MPDTDLQSRFITLATEYDALRFGSFTLKSGRVSPYFFNAGLFNDAKALALLGDMYAEAIVASGLEFDVLFGPAYKGIPLASVTAASLYKNHNMNIAYSFNRKEAKKHGEGGHIVGAALKGRILVIDDVITAGTAIRESADLIKQSGATLSGIIIAVDRQEKGQGELSAVQEVEQNTGASVLNLVTFQDLVAYLAAHQKETELTSMNDYRSQYGI